jgi:hypothetical protein
MTIESIVRPFQTPDVAPARTVLHGRPRRASARDHAVRPRRRRQGAERLGSYSASFYMTQYVNEKREASGARVLVAPTSQRAGAARRTSRASSAPTRRASVLDDIWADVERMDVIKSAMQIPPDQWQGVQRKLLWCDDPTHRTTTRRTGRRRAQDRSPQGLRSRNTETSTIPRNGFRSASSRVMKSSQGGSEGLMGEGFMDRFLNAVFNEELRRARSRSAASFITTPTSTIGAGRDRCRPDPEGLCRRPARIHQGRGTKDKSQYVEYEIAPTSSTRATRSRCSTARAGRPSCSTTI